MAKIFVSHSHRDAALVSVLKEQITKELEISSNEVFTSSTPDAIPVGDWHKKVLKTLKNAKIIIPLITPSSVKSTWVAFEYGYFRARNKDTELVHTLFHPKTQPLSPLHIPQAKRFTDREELRVFFEAVCKSLGRPVTKKADLDAIIAVADKIPMVTSEEEQFQLICKLQLMAAETLDAKTAIIQWMIEKDILHDAKFAWIGDLRQVNFMSSKKAPNLKRIDLGGNDLCGANFWGADLDGAHLGTTILKGARFQHAYLRETSLADAHFDENTILPDCKTWTRDTDMGRFTDPNHTDDNGKPDFYRPNWVKEREDRGWTES